MSVVCVLDELLAERSPTITYRELARASVISAAVIERLAQNRLTYGQANQREQEYHLYLIHFLWLDRVLFGLKQLLGRTVTPGEMFVLDD